MNAVERLLDGRLIGSPLILFRRWSAGLMCLGTDGSGSTVALTLAFTQPNRFLHHHDLTSTLRRGRSTGRQSPSPRHHSAPTHWLWRNAAPRRHGWRSTARRHTGRHTLGRHTGRSLLGHHLLLLLHLLHLLLLCKHLQITLQSRLTAVSVQKSLNALARGHIHTVHG